jgi:hypothetical protein
MHCLLAHACSSLEGQQAVHCMRACRESLVRMLLAGGQVHEAYVKEQLKRPPMRRAAAAAR